MELDKEESELISSGNKLQLHEENSVCVCVCLCFVSSNARCKPAPVEARGVDGVGSDSVPTCKHLLQNT